MFSLTSTVASAKLTSKVRPHPFAPAPRTRFRSRDLERERFPTQKARYNEWIFSFFFFGGWDVFSRHQRQKGGLHTRKILQRRRRKRRRRERGGVFFYPVATKKRARIARESARETRCDRARAGGDVAFSSSSLFFARTRRRGRLCGF